MPDLPIVDSADAAETLRRHLDQFDGLTKQRGSQYQRKRAVIQLRQINPTTIGAGVVGTELYAVLLSREGTVWINSCTCPVRQNCKHVYAVGLQWLAEQRKAGFFNTPSAAAIEPEKAPAPPVFLRSQLESLVADKLGRPLTPREVAFLATLSQIFANLQHSHRLSPTDVRRLGFETLESRRGPFSTAYEHWWEEPPANPLELWQYLAFDIESSGLATPEFMRPLTDTSHVRAYLHNRERRAAIARWEDRFRRLLQTPPTARITPPDSKPIELRLRLLPGKWELEQREGPDAPWRTAKAWLEKVSRGEIDFLDVNASPAVIGLLALCREHFRRQYLASLSPHAPGGLQLLHQILRHPVLRTLVTDPTGAPLRFAPEPLVWQITRSVEEPRDYVIGLRFADGQPLPPEAVHLPGDPQLYLHQHVIYEGPPALDGQSAASAIVPAEVIEHTEVLRGLHRMGARLPAEFEQRFVPVPLRPQVLCRLSADQDPHELLELKLVASADDPPIEQVWTDQGWVAPPSPPTDPLPADGPIHLMDTMAADAVARRLPEAKVQYDVSRQRWTRRVTRTFADEFLAWRESLPPEVEVLATGDLAGLLGAPVRARVDFQLLESSVHRDWFDLALALRPEDSTLTKVEIALLLKARGRLVRLPGKGWRRLTVELDDEAQAALEAAGFERLSIAEAALAGERHRFHTLQLAQPGLAEHWSKEQAALLRERTRALTDHPPPPLPAGVRASMRPYQKEGYEFLAFLSIHGLGGVLADDMGLGKTLQTLAWLLWLAEQPPEVARAPQDPRRLAGGALRALVICPKSVVGNWQTEAERFTPALKVIRFAPERSGKIPEWDEARPTLVVANYTQLRLQAETFRSHAWDAVVLDEGQFIKNPSSKVAQTARELPGQHRLVLTGTPVENRLLDLWSLFAFAMPGLLGSQASFKRLYSPDDPQALKRLRGRVRHFLLRRTKGQVAADLPPRTEEDLLVDLEGEQARFYQAELKRARAQLLGVKSARQFDQERLNILASLLRLRQICCHPALIDPAQADAPAAKLEALLERVEELRDEGHQVLVFSQFVTMLELIAPRLTAAGVDYLMLTGQTENRDALVAEFQANRSRTVFLLSLKAAGFGLNLTAASYVILYDPWWNPAVEAQAIDRTHRIGQTAPVNAYRFIARGTVEEKIRILQREKAALASAVVQEESLARVLDLDSLRQILS